MSEDSLINEEEEEEEEGEEDIQQTSSTTPNQSKKNRQLKSTINGTNRSNNNHDEHIKLVIQKKQEADVKRLQEFQEQLRKKEQKWQQQQLERVKKWLQLRNRDTDHRIKVAERRKKREEAAKAKFDEILRREKEREQRTNSQITVNLRGNASHRPDSVMSASTDILSTRRAISAPRIRSNYQNMTNRRGSNDSPITTTSQENADNPATTISSHQLNPIDEQRHRHRQSRHPHDVTMTNEDNSLSGTPRSSAHNRSRLMPTSYAYWINTGDNNNNTVNANFMRLTYAASCRSRLSRSVERCPRACRGRDEITNNTNTTTTTPTTNGDLSQRRVQSINRQHFNEMIHRLSKPKNISMAQSIHLGATSASSSANGIPMSQSSHQLRVPTPPMTASTTPPTSRSRRNIQTRPATAPSHNIFSNNDSRSSPSDELTSEHQSTSSSIRQSSHRTTTHPKQSSSSKPPVSSTFTRPKQPVQRSVMTNSHSSSSVSTTTSTPTATTANKQNIRRIGGVPPSKRKPKSEPQPSTEILESQILTKDNEKENLPVNEEIQANEKEELEQKEEVEEIEVEEVQNPDDKQSATPPVEPINIDTVTEIINPTTTEAPAISKREQKMLEEQEYQRKLNQKIREAQQRLEAERQREEERQRQLELEEYEREQEQIRLVEEQRLAEEERLKRAIEERERENELKRQEEQRLQQQREELERKQAEETERLNRERQERAKKEEEERNERKKRLDLIMRRTRQVSPSPKPENNVNKTDTDETNEHEQQQLSFPHSISDNRIPTSLSTENIVNNNDLTTPETSKFKSPLIQSLLNKARNTRSTDNLIQSSMTTSQIVNENEIDEGITTTTTKTTINRTDLSDDNDDDDVDDDQQDSGINNTTNGHSDSPLSSSTNFNSYHDRPIETATAFQ